MWAINKSPLMLGGPVDPSMTGQSSLDILSNAEVIAINQDPLGKQAQLVRRYTEEEWDIWAGELSDSRLVLAVANWRNDSQTVDVDLAAAGVASAAARDVWAAEDLGQLSGVQAMALAGHELKLLVLSDIVNATAPASASYHSVADAVVGGAAKLQSCGEDECLPANSKVVDLAGEASVSFSGVQASCAGAKLLGVDFINYEVALGTAWDWGSNTRNMTISVNGGEAKRWAFPISGGNWFETGRLTVEVDGFKEGENDVVFGASTDSIAPHLVGFEVFE